MKAHEAFGVIVRALGIWFVFQGSYTCYFGILKMLNVPMRSSALPIEDFAIGGYTALAGLFLIFAAGMLANVFYSNRSGNGAESPEIRMEISTHSSIKFDRSLLFLKYTTLIVLIGGLVNVAEYLYGRIAIGNLAEPTAFTAYSSWMLIGGCGQVVWYCLSQLNRGR